MTIGLILSKTPAYSETFFISKIKGLQEFGHRVILFVQHKEPDFNLCEVRIAPNVSKKNKISQIAKGLYVVMSLIPYLNRIWVFKKLEKQSKRTNSQLLKNIYNNAHLLTSKLDWIHFGFATIALQSENVAKAINAKMAVSFRGFDVDVYPIKHTGCYQLLWKRVDKIHSISHYLMQQAGQVGLPNNVPFQIITPAIDFEIFKKDNQTSVQPPQLLTIARLHWIKDIVGILEALSILKLNGLDFTYRIIGSGSEYEQIAFTICQLNLSDRVQVLGSKNQSEIIDSLHATTMYLQYSQSEGFCNAVLEAQAAGCLCIVSDGGALPENILNKETGFVVPKRNPTLLAKKVMEVLNLQETEKDRIIRSAQRHILVNHNLKNQKLEFSKFYE